MSLGPNKELVRRTFDEAWAEGSIEVLDEICSGDAVLYGVPTSEKSCELRGLKEFITSCRDAFPDLEVTVEDMIAEDDRIVVRSTIAGTHDGAVFMDTKPGGKEVEVAAMTTYRIEGGMIAEAWMCFDMLGMLRQIGAVPPHPHAYDWEQIEAGS